MRLTVTRTSPQTHGEWQRIILRCNGDAMNANSYGGWQSQHQGVLAMIADAIAPITPGELRPFEVVISTSDKHHDGAWGVTPHDAQDPVTRYPCFDFHHWPEIAIDDYQDAVNSLYARRDGPAHDVVFWGGCDTRRGGKGGQTRREILDRIEGEPGVRVVVNNRIAHHKGRDELLSDSLFAPWWEWQNYWGLIDLCGIYGSCGLKMKIATGRPVFWVRHPHLEYWMDGLQDGLHFIACENGEDLRRKIELYRKPELRAEAERIGKQGQEYSKRNLQRHHAVEYWRGLLRREGA